MELGVEHFVADGSLVELFPDWPGDIFPMYAYYPSRHHVPAKVRVFLDFMMEVAHHADAGARRSWELPGGAGPA
jgi:DNA-binding transcriptional LysR family regulator